MERQIFINLPVQDLNKSMAYYTALGFSNHTQWSDDTAKCMVWSEHVYVMLLSYEKFASFTTRPIANTQDAIAGIYSLSLDSVAEMNTLMQRH